jgi:DNA mismatch repair protein MutL
MTSVRVLPDDLVNQIAAGEVVERPASVVKELVENSLDAGATRVEVAIEAGGLRSITVSDDGSGLARVDAELAFERHATSKIAAADDLARVATLGFRGEALPSIASVARVRMCTRRPEDPVGVELRGEGRGISSTAEIACPPGTRVEVAEIFEQVPARRKFLKSPATESTHVARWLERIALVRPDVRFSLERDGRRSFAFLPTADVRERVIAVLPPSVGEHLLPVEGQIERAAVTGLASPTHVRRATSADIHLYVNTRPVRDRLLLHAVREAYRDALPPGRHPAVVLFVQVEPDEVDVNVHPAKWEVRFRDPAAIRRLVRDAIVRGIGAASHLYPAFGDAGAGESVREPRSTSAGPAPWSAPDRLERYAAPAHDAGPAGDWLLARESAAVRELDRERPASFAALRYLGQALGTFLVLEGEGALVLLDQHAAHERVLFERMRQGLLDGKLERQALLLTEWLELPGSAAAALLEHRDWLGQAGFELEVGDETLRGTTRIGLREVPAALADRRPMSWQAMLEETAALLSEAPGSVRDGLEGALHTALATAACHAACRKGERLDPRDVKGLLEALDETVWFPNCPHGRPILAVLAADELERRFLRR